MHDAVVVGGGIVGSSAAYHLARAGAETLLIDRRDEGRATDAGAGIVSPETSRHESTAWYELALEAVAYYPELVEALRDDGVEGTGYRECGTLVVPTGADDRDFEEGRDRVYRRQSEYDHPPADRLYDLPPDEARERFPPLAEVPEALYYDGGARVDGRTFESALRAAGERHGLETLDASAERIEGDGEVRAVVADGERLPTAAAVVAGGAWSPAFEDRLGIEIPVDPERGQIAHLSTDADTGAWPIVNTFRGHYLVPFSGGRVAAGATREADTGFVPEATAGGVRKVLDDALGIAPGLADAELEEVRVGLRPAPADGLPVLGPTGLRGAYVATGHGSTGLQLGPYSGKLVADAVLDRPPGTDLSAFSPDRF